MPRARNALDVAQQQSTLLEQTIIELQISLPKLRRLRKELDLKAAMQKSRLQMLIGELADVVEQVDPEAATALRANVKQTVVRFTPPHR